MISVVVSALNEEKNLPVTIEKLVRASELEGGVPLDIIIVNDGSTDGTQAVAEALCAEYPFVRVIQFATNRGIGAGIIASLDIAKYPKICNFPGDNACSTYIMRELFRNANKADFLVSYIINTEERGYKRQVISALYSFIYLFMFRLPIRYVNGSPMYTVAQLKKLNLQSNRYSVLAEAAIKLLRSGVTFIEIGDYIKPNQTKTSALRWRNFKEVFRVFLYLIFEVHVRHKQQFSRRSQRILPGLEL